MIGAECFPAQTGPHPAPEIVGQVHPAPAFSQDCPFVRLTPHAGGREPGLQLRQAMGERRARPRPAPLHQRRARLRVCALPKKNTRSPAAERPRPGRGPRDDRSPARRIKRRAHIGKFSLRREKERALLLFQNRARRSGEIAPRRESFRFRRGKIPAAAGSDNARERPPRSGRRRSGRGKNSRRKRKQTSGSHQAA